MNTKLFVLLAAGVLALSACNNKSADQAAADAQQSADQAGQAASDAANDMLAQKQAAFDASVVARNQAFTARAGVDDPAWIAADGEWTQAGIDRDQAQQAADVAAGRLAIAQAAVDDPANPPLEAQA